MMKDFSADAQTEYMTRGFFVRASEKGREALSALSAHHCTTHAGTLTFFLVLSVVPCLFLLILFFGRAEVAELPMQGIFARIRALVDPLRENAERAAGGAGVFFVLTSLWSGSGFFYHLRRSGEMIYGVRRGKGWRVRLSALLFTLLLLFFFAGVGAMLCAGFSALGGLPNPVRGLLGSFLLFLAGTAAAWLLNLYVCPFRMRVREAAAGSLFTSLSWLAAALLFSFLPRLGREELYGALSLVVAALLFLYWMMVCFTAGVILNLGRCRGRGPRKDL